jgi:hypothetical protein
MALLSATEWKITAEIVCLVLLGAAAVWLLVRRRPTEDELERARRQFLTQSGRLVDGMLLDVCKMEAKDGRTLTLLIFNYRIGGVDYECSQDITSMLGVIDAEQVRPGFPCSVRYQPGSPQNIIVVAEEWSGLRASLQDLRRFGAREPVEPRRRLSRYR